VGDESGDAVYREVSAFLVREARLLDNRRFAEWLKLLTDDVRYEVPVRVTQAREAGPEFVPESRWMGDDRASLEARVRRMQARYPVAVDPPSRTRHFVANVELAPGAGPDEVQVVSNVLVYRSRGDTGQHDLFSAERHDVLRRVDGRWKLARREVLLDQTVLGAQDLAFFF
jgi:3-phenylpropionate/cinnamic acid dioxygenase small subunit